MVNRVRRWARPRLAVIGYLILTAGVVFALYMFHRNEQHIEQARIERIQLINKGMLESCLDTEQHKAQHRKEARESYREAQDNARVLGIEFTGELRRRLREELAEALKEHRRERCPRNPIPAD